MGHPNRMLSKLLVVSILIFIHVTTWAAPGFVINEIRVQGNQRVQMETVLDYLPIHLGQRLTQAQMNEVISAVYQSGFFSDVALQREGDTLIVKVKERPTVNSISFSGNHVIKKDKIDEVLKDVGLVRGNTFDEAVLGRVEKSLRGVYIEQGRYNSSIQTTVTPLSRNRVSIVVHINEGEKVRVREIRIVGNHAFSQKQLIKQFDLTTPKLWSFLTDGDKYSKEKFEHDLMALRKFYRAHGYLQAKVVSDQVVLTPDKAWAYLIIRVNEGEVYHFKGYRFLGQLAAAAPELHKLVPIEKGNTYSGDVVSEASKQLTTYYGDKGYAFADIQVVPNVDEKNKQIFINFYIEPGKHIYVRHINFSGNIKTSDEVLRREMRQLEGALYNQAQVDESLRRLRNLGYLPMVNMSVRPVANAEDQIDLVVTVKEKSAAQAMVSAGFVVGGGLIYGLSLSHQNFLGDG